MPHIIVEYAKTIATEKQIAEVLQAIHHSITDSGLFKAEQIRTRAYPFVSFTNAGNSEPYMHIQARIKAGRDVDNKRQLTEVILAALKGRIDGAQVATCEVIDMERASYAKYVP